MIDEANVTEEKEWYYEDLARIVKKSLKRGNIEARYVKNRQEALTYVLSLIPEGAVVGRGGGWRT